MQEYVEDIILVTDDEIKRLELILNLQYWYGTAQTFYSSEFLLSSSGLQVYKVA